MFETEKVMEQQVYEDVTPDPEFLIKSIAEQGYTLETALSDLIDNSISAKASRIDILTYEKEGVGLRLIIADDGIGMSEEQLRQNIRFPSSDVDEDRDKEDLGRFGLGLKTASFSQSRRFTVVSRTKGSETYYARTWDVSVLKSTKKWQIIAENMNYTGSLVSEYFKEASKRQNQFVDFTPNTFVIWDGLYKFNDYYSVDKAYDKLKELLMSQTKGYLGTIFHKYLEKIKGPLRIRLNNSLVESFNPFADPSAEYPVQYLDVKRMKFGDDFFTMRGLILPVEASKQENLYTPKNKSLTDMEGIYIYREKRMIYFGGWNGLTKRGDKFKLARLEVQVGNKNDNRLHLNVAKSKITIPFELLDGVVDYIAQLRGKSVLELSKRGLKKKSSSKQGENIDLLSKVLSTKKGAVYFVNENYPVLKVLTESLTSDQKYYLKTVMGAVNNLINNQKSGTTDFPELEIEKDLTKDLKVVLKLKGMGLNLDDVYYSFLKEKGYTRNQLPIEIEKLFN